jgi:hypothetical protein
MGNEVADRVDRVDLLLVEPAGGKVDAIVLLEENGDLDTINRLQPASCENGRIICERVAISLLHQQVLQQVPNCRSTFHESPQIKIEKMAEEAEMLHRRV